MLLRRVFCDTIGAVIKKGVEVQLEVQPVTRGAMRALAREFKRARGLVGSDTVEGVVNEALSRFRENIAFCREPNQLFDGWTVDDQRKTFVDPNRVQRLGDSIIRRGRKVGKRPL